MLGKHLKKRWLDLGLRQKERGSEDRSNKSSPVHLQLEGASLSPGTTRDHSLPGVRPEPRNRDGVSYSFFQVGREYVCTSKIVLGSVDSVTTSVKLA